MTNKNEKEIELNEESIKTRCEFWKICQTQEQSLFPSTIINYQESKRMEIKRNGLLQSFVLN